MLHHNHKLHNVSENLPKSQETYFLDEQSIEKLFKIMINLWKTIRREKRNTITQFPFLDKSFLKFVLYFNSQHQSNEKTLCFATDNSIEH